MQRTILALMLLVLVAGSACADDVITPPWDRGSDRSTYQRWEFWQGNMQGQPDDWYNPYGIATVSATPTYHNLYSNRLGVWEVGDIWVHIPNAPDHPDWVKKLQIQLTWQPNCTQMAFPLVEVGATQTGPMYTAPVYVTDPMFDPINWMHTTYRVSLPFNPECEWVHISGLLFVDELVIDTKCAPVPEPMTLVLSALGLVTVGGFRRLRK